MSDRTKATSEQVTTKELVEALQDVIEARTAHDDAFKEYGGYSWGYVGHSLIQAIHDAEEKFGRRLDLLIDQRVAAAIARSQGDV